MASVFFRKIIIDITSKIAQRNYKKVLSKFKKTKLKVVFHLYDKSKWKCQALYNTFLNDENFEVKILISKYFSKDKNNVNQQTTEEVIENYNYFKNKGLDVELAYDVNNKKYIPLSAFEPDVIIYQHPWGINKVQYPFYCSKFALCYYIPYATFPFGIDVDYSLDFYKYLFKYCVLNQKIHDFYLSKTNLKNMIVVGHPWYDKAILNIEENCVIYAPHWTINCGIALSAFDWSGEFILEFAKKNPQYNWIFKPHPLFKKALLKFSKMNEEQIEKYYSSWAEIGIICNDCDYLKYFNSSKMLITDCASFLGEYFATKKPLVRLNSKEKMNLLFNEIVDCYYQANNPKELEDILNQILINNNDYLKEKRRKIAQELSFSSINSSKSIIDNIKNEFKINN